MLLISQLESFSLPNHHPFTNHNLPHEQVVAFFVPLYVALEGLQDKINSNSTKII